MTLLRVALDRSFLVSNMGVLLLRFAGVLLERSLVA